MTAPFADDTLVDLAPASPDDKEMALAFQRGDEGAYQAIYDRHQERVHRVCRRMLVTREDAQEAAQETFLRVYTALGKFNGRYQLGAWITRIATNVCLDHIRSRARHPVESAPVEKLELDFLSPDFESDPQTVTVKNAESRRVRKVLRGLPPLHRAAIVLRDFEGLSYAEVGVALGMTESQVKALIHRARKGFRRSWTPLAELLVPARLLQRWREADVSVKEHVVNAATAQSAPIASICSGVLQQCGSFVVQKVAPLATTAILGGTAIAAPGALRAEAPAAPAPAVDALTAETDGPPVPRAPEDSRPAGGAPAPAPAEPAPIPTPAPEPEPSPSPAPSGSPSAPPATASPPAPSGTVTTPKETTATPTPTPAPPPFLPELYFQTGHTPTRRAPSAHTARVDCSTRSVGQTTSAQISDHEGVYPIDLRLKTSSSTLEMEFTVRKKGFAVYYSGGGVLVAQSSSGNHLRLTFNGRYGSGGTAAESAGLPVNGSIRAELVLDCTAQSLVAESVALTTQ